jgi:amino acid transporter
MTAVAFERAVGSRWIVNVILAAALLSLLKVFNGNFVAASRLLFALGRRGLVDRRFAVVHPENCTPSMAVAATGLATGACMFLGQALLVPISEVGSVASATGWMAACAAYYGMRPTPGKRGIAALGAAVGLMMIGMKVIPAMPGHFSVYEWLALIIWIGVGAALHAREKMLAPAKAAN